MGLAAQLANYTTLTPPELSRPNTPAERERRKTAQQRAEDFIYTLNHAITCLSLTDFLIAPFFSSVFGWNICGHGHDHGKDGSAAHGGGGSSEHKHYPGCGHDHSTSGAAPAAASPAEPPVSTKYPNATGVTPEQLLAGDGKTAEQRLEELKKALKDGNKPPRHAKRGGFSGLIDAASGAEPASEGSGMLPPAHSLQPTISSSGGGYSGHPTPAPAPQTWWGKAKAWFVATYEKHYPNMREWFIGEAIGDLGAVPATLLVQHFTPGVMTGIQHGLEPIVGGLMHRRAQRAAEKWADQNGIARDARECIDHAENLYRYEIRHLPQMVMWTISSCAINYGVMKYRNPAMAMADFAKGKVAGASITAGLVFGTRSLVPEAAHKWDETMGRKVVVPVTKKIGRLFGIEERDVDAYHAQRRDDAPRSWADKVKEPVAEAVRSA